MDSLCLKNGIHGISPSISGSCGFDVRPNPSQVSAMGRSTVEKSTMGQKKTKFSRFSFKYPLKSLWPGKGKGGYGGLAPDDAVLVENGEVRAGDEGDNVTIGSEGQSENWVLKILQVRSLWREEQGKNVVGLDMEESGQEEKDRVGAANDKRNETNVEESEGCDVCRVEDDDENEAEFDRNSFSQLLRRVSLADARLYAQMSYLGNLAYNVPKIKSGNLLRRYGLSYVTSSIDKRELAAQAEKKQETPEVQVAERNQEDKVEENRHVNNRYKINASVAYQIAASAASYLYSHTRSILPFKSLKAEDGKDFPNESGASLDGVGMINSEMANLMATTDSVTAVVAAKEEVKQAVADDLNSILSSPCEWFICDDDKSGTRFFTIQGSESLASWQANLLFEPIQFEGRDVLVHRGIYEAAKGIYEQMLPEVCEHLKSRGGHATFRFSGHSLGGSLALLINLMLLIRNEVPVSSLLPVITFGAPSIMCGGDILLRKLGLPRKHVQAIMMHRDIVPRAFSCNYPNHVAEFLKAVNGNFRNHPCLNNQKLLYAPMGELLILQPDEKLSPNLDLLPSGTGLYLLSCPLPEVNNAEKQLRAAKTLFFNSPHPLEVLRDRSSYGSDGSIQRDHDMNSYLKSVRGVIRQDLNRIRKVNREHRHKVGWPLLTPRSVNAGILVGRSVVSINMDQNQSNFSGIMQTGRESLKRFSRLVASQHMHLFVVLLFPARLLLLGAFSVFSSR